MKYEARYAEKGQLKAELARSVSKNRGLRISCYPTRGPVNKLLIIIQKREYFQRNFAKIFRKVISIN